MLFVEFFFFFRNELWLLKGAANRSRLKKKKKNSQVMLTDASAMVLPVCFFVLITQRQFRNLHSIRIVSSVLKMMSRCAVAFIIFLLFKCSAEVQRALDFSAVSS